MDPTIYSPYSPGDQRGQLVQSGESLALLLRFAGWIAILLGLFALVGGLVGQNILVIISGVGMMIQGVISLVAATFIESLAKTVAAIMDRVDKPTPPANPTQA